MAALGKASDESRESFFREHAELRAQAEAAGELLPEITSEGILAITREAAQTAGAEAVSHKHPLPCGDS